MVALPGTRPDFFTLISSVFIEGYFLFSEQFTVMFLLIALIMTREKSYIIAGMFLGLACGFKQYALLALLACREFADSNERQKTR
jgi:uncharacterized membrane protein